MNGLPIALKLGVLALGVAAVASGLIADGGGRRHVDERTLANIQGDQIEIPTAEVSGGSIEPLSEDVGVIQSPVEASSDALEAEILDAETAEEAISASETVAPSPEVLTTQSPEVETAVLVEPTPELEPSDSQPETELELPPTLIESGFETVGFDVLAGFEYQVTDDFLLIEEGSSVVVAGPEIPGRVRELDGRSVAVTGYMLPLKVVGKDAVEEFLLLRSQALCCYGAVPEVNEWISVRMPNTPAKSLMDRPVTVKGTLQVGEMREEGYLVGIYDMVGDSVEVALNE